MDELLTALNDACDGIRKLYESEVKSCDMWHKIATSNLSAIYITEAEIDKARANASIGKDEALDIINLALKGKGQ